MGSRRILVGLVGLAAFAAVESRAATARLATSPPSLSAGQCVPSRNVGCSNHGRFSVEVAWQNQFNGTSGKGVVVPAASSDVTLAFSFGDPANIELLVKLLDFGDVVKLFYGELTDLHFQITVADTAHGTVKTYSNTPGDCGAIDDAAFPGQEPAPAAGAAAVSRAAAAGAAPMGSCHPTATTLCLLNGRFAATVTWQNQFNGVIGVGMAGPLSSETGTFYFTDPTDKELLVKILDFGDRIGVFYGTLSNLQYTLQVTDTSTGGTKTYFNPPGNYCGGIDNAFPSDLTASTSITLIPVPVANTEHRTDDIALVPFTTATGGNLEVDADWTSAADNIQLVLFRGDCTLQDAVQNACDPNQIADARAMVKPQQLLEPLLPPGTYTIMVIDAGPNDETGTMTAKLTP
ncbi:MAG TPA: hypothetical protein VHB47_04815 [Thermoanaerobaculia bacterium]|jgi:hypothetical protein|nr:hypothetical protein [Thermoanaerobaculia bacterium]